MTGSLENCSKLCCLLVKQKGPFKQPQPGVECLPSKAFRSKNEHAEVSATSVKMKKKYTRAKKLTLL